MDHQAASELVRLGGDPSGFRSRRVSAGLLADADFILTMSYDLRAETLQFLPRALRQTFTLGELVAIVSSPSFFAGTGVASLRDEASRMRGGIERAADIPDPMGRSQAVHRKTADQISADLEALLPALVSAL